MLPRGQPAFSILTALHAVDLVGERGEVGEPDPQVEPWAANSSRKPAEPSADGIGWRITVVTNLAQTPVPSTRSRPKNGTRPVLTLSPRIDSVAGRKVRLPATATRMTPIVPTAIDRKIETSIRNRPAIEIIPPAR